MCLSLPDPSGLSIFPALRHCRAVFCGSPYLAGLPNRLSQLPGLESQSTACSSIIFQTNWKHNSLNKININLRKSGGLPTGVGNQPANDRPGADWARLGASDTDGSLFPTKFIFSKSGFPKLCQSKNYLVQNACKFWGRMQVIAAKKLTDELLLIHFSRNLYGVLWITLFWQGKYSWPKTITNYRQWSLLLLTIVG